MQKLPNSLAFTGYRANFNPAYLENDTHHPDLSLVERRSSVLYCIFPSFVVSFSPHFMEYMCLRPLTVDSVGVRWGVVGVEENPESPSVKEELRFLREVYAEDRAMLEGLQKGLRTHYYNQGPLAGDNVEGTIWDILQYMASRLGSDRLRCAPKGADYDPRPSIFSMISKKMGPISVCVKICSK